MRHGLFRGVHAAMAAGIRTGRPALVPGKVRVSGGDRAGIATKATISISGHDDFLRVGLSTAITRPAGAKFRATLTCLPHRDRRRL
jgi:hypothetical protein